MKKLIVLCFLLLVGAAVLAQDRPASTAKTPKKSPRRSIGIGLKAGLNFANVSNASTINGKSQTGFHAGIFYSPPSRSILSSHTEIIFSRQGYNYSTDSSKGSVKLNYLTLAQLMAINITKYVQVQFGGQFSYLLNAQADSSLPSTGNATADQILKYYNRFDYGFAIGLELHPYPGIVIAAKYNISLSNLYKLPSGNDSVPSFIPSAGSINLKNNVVQLSIGYQF